MAIATLSVTDITAYLRVAVPYTYAANEFAGTSPDDCAFVRLTGGFKPSEWTSKAKPSFQIVVRAKLPQTAEAQANAIYEHLHRRAEFKFGVLRVVKCLADQSAPMYLGKDANGRAVYSLNFTITTI